MKDLRNSNEVLVVMVVCSSIKICAKTVLSLHGRFQKQMRNHIFSVASPTPSSSCCFILKQGNSRTRYSCISIPCTSSPRLPDCGFQALQQVRYRCSLSSKRGCYPILTFKSSVRAKEPQRTSIDFSSGYQNVSLRILSPRNVLPNFRCNVGLPKGSVTAGVISGLLVCYSTSESAHAEAVDENSNKEECEDSSSHFSYGKRVHTDYSVIGIPGDGRCLFRSVAHGACLRSGKPAPGESHQKQLADELRGMVAVEFIRRRQETEWFIEGDFDHYVSQIRKPHVWGGEPELLMLSHVLRMPITVYMRDDKYGGLIPIAEYGQDYGKDNPIRVLYHGYGHYDALLMPGRKGTKSRL